MLTGASGDEITVHACSGAAAESPPPDRFTLLPDHTAIREAVRPELGPHLLTGPVAVDGAEAVGRPMTFVVEVSMERERADPMDAFKHQVRAAPEV